MELIFITRKIDKADPKAGFVFDWVNKLAKHVDKLHVITWHKSKSEDLADNIELHNLATSKLLKIVKLKSLLLILLPKSNGVFAHQMPIYAIIAGPLCKIFKKKLVLWYTHSNVDWQLRLANKFVDEFATASAESFLLKTNKPLHIMNHGINTNKFSFNEMKLWPTDSINLLTVSRLSPTKNIELMLELVENLKLNLPQLKGNIKLKIIGGPGNLEQFQYVEDLKKICESKGISDNVEFLGPLEQDQTIAHYHKADIFLNFSDTGSLDKAVLEAMSTGTLVLTTNVSFEPILPDIFFSTTKNPDSLAHKVEQIFYYSQDEKYKHSQNLRQIVEKNHNLDNLTHKISQLFK
jgi:glycosyltransferase involved in cell wall biosynthesis